MGKLIHEGPLETAQSSTVDFNRAGVPLMEIVSRPDMRSPAEAAAYLRTLRTIVVYLGVCDGNMEEGSLRCDANVSLRPAGSQELGVKVEIKNMNSFRNVQHALEYEVKRQVRALAEGEDCQETRLWDPNARTVSMRSRVCPRLPLFPEPDRRSGRGPVGRGDPPLCRSAGRAPPALRRRTDIGVRRRPSHQGTGLADYFETTVRVRQAQDRRQLGAQRLRARCRGR